MYGVLRHGQALVPIRLPGFAEFVREDAQEHLHGLIRSLSSAVSLRVVRRRHILADVPEIAQLGPHSRSEPRVSIRDDAGWHAVVLPYVVA